nr:PIN domain-containing protein [Candidatus Freyarchaeota archaeon]
MKNYGLLPNDALILVTCKFYGIRYLISFDEDFRRACEEEKIILLENINKIEEISNNDT